MNLDLSYIKSVIVVHDSELRCVLGLKKALHTYYLFFCSDLNFHFFFSVHGKGMPARFVHLYDGKHRLEYVWGYKLFTPVHCSGLFLQAPQRNAFKTTSKYNQIESHQEQYFRFASFSP